MNEKKKLEKIRSDIDSLDKQLLELISNRARLAQEIAKIKIPDLNTNDLSAASNMIKGTARSMGIQVR